MNMAYTNGYLAWRRECEAIFCEECCSQDMDEVKEKQLGGGWQLNARFYEGIVSGCSIRGSDNELLDGQGRVRYRWRNLDDAGEFQQIIKHSNGQEYLIFRRDLYGYSVLELGSMKDFHYIPGQSFPYGKENFSETFIWTGVHYDSYHSRLAVTGCFWACPYSVVVLDFSDPMALHEDWVDIHMLIDEGYETYDDIEFVRWEPDGALVLEGFSADSSRMEPLVLPAKQLNKL